MHWTAGGIVARESGKERMPFRGEDRIAPSRSALGIPGCVPQLLVLARDPPHRGRALVGFALGGILWAMLAVVEYGRWMLIVPPRGKRGRNDGDADLTPRPPSL